VLAEAVTPLAHVVGIAALLLSLVGGLMYLRWRLLRDRPVTVSETWGCGYAQPTARMQYTASSFSQPVTELFRPMLGTTTSEKPVLSEYFPAEQALTTETPDLWRERLYQPVFLAVRTVLAGLHWLQHGRLQVYVLYVALTIFFLLIWYLGFAA
jgi:hypothetical protein